MSLRAEPGCKEPSRHRARPLSAAATAIAAVMLVGGSVAASTIDEQRREVERITDELERLEAEVVRLTEEANVYAMEQDELAGEIATAERRVAAREQEVRDLEDALAAVAADAFVSAGTPRVSVVFRDARTFNEQMQAEQYSRVALDVGGASADDLEEIIRDLNDEKADLEAKRAEAAQLAERAEQAAEQAERSVERYEAEREAAEQRLGELIEEEQRRRAEEERQRILAQQRAAEEEARRQAEAEQQAAAQPWQTGAGGRTSDGSSAGAGGSTGTGGSSGGPPPATSPPAPPTPQTPPSQPPPTSHQGQVAVNAARGQLNVPYRFGAMQPGVAFDCSGLTKWAWAQAGVTLPRTAREQAHRHPRVDVSQLRPGDLIFSYPGITHVAIYSGNGNRIHAPYTGSTVREGPVYWQPVQWATRPG